MDETRGLTEDVFDRVNEDHSDKSIMSRFALFMGPVDSSQVLDRQQDREPPLSGDFPGLAGGMVGVERRGGLTARWVGAGPFGPHP
ncbi:hypothetical protein [Streptomyces spiralis]|uniref:hypothetical protein n=1 Tax=Streptomyces spiralis TaxID=66376 RepID=UPI00369C3BB3